MAKIAVIGAGNGGCALAAHFAIRGYAVSIYNREEESFHEVERLKGVYYTGALGEGFARFTYAGSSIEQALDGVEDVMVVVPRHTHEHYADLLRPYLRPGMGIALIPGSGTSLLFAHRWREELSKMKIDLMESSTLCYSARLESASKIHVYKIRETLPGVSITGYPSRIWDRLAELFCLTRQPNIVAAILNNLNPILHPAGMIMNAGWIENGGDFLFYKEGCSPAVAQVMERADTERCAILCAFGLPAQRLVDAFFEAKYTDEEGKASGTIYGALQNSKPNSTIRAPSSLSYRFLCEDVSCGLVAFYTLAGICGVNAPTIELLIRMASLIDGIDYFQTGLNLERMGLEGKKMEELLQIGAG